MMGRPERDEAPGVDAGGFRGHTTTDGINTATAGAVMQIGRHIGPWPAGHRPSVAELHRLHGRGFDTTMLPTLEDFDLAGVNPRTGGVR